MKDTSLPEVMHTPAKLAARGLRLARKKIHRPRSAARISFATIACFFMCCAHAETQRDPTQPPVVRSATPERAAAPELRVEAILLDGDRRVAIVNGKVVRAGDRVGASLITGITRDSVQYLRGGKARSAALARTKFSLKRELATNEDQS